MFEKLWVGLNKVKKFQHWGLLDYLLLHFIKSTFVTFSLSEAAEVAILPFFDASGGTDSERTFVKQIIQIQN